MHTHVLMLCRKFELIPIKIGFLNHSITSYNVLLFSLSLSSLTHVHNYIYMYMHTISVLDDNELYEVQEYFTQYQLGRLTIFLNNLIFYCIWEQEILYSSLVRSTRSCLILLLQRNQRRSFVPQDFLLIK